MYNHVPTIGTCEIGKFEFLFTGIAPGVRQTNHEHRSLQSVIHNHLQVFIILTPVTFRKSILSSRAYWRRFQARRRQWNALLEGMCFGKVVIACVTRAGSGCIGFKKRCSAHWPVEKALARTFGMVLIRGISCWSASFKLVANSRSKQRRWRQISSGCDTAQWCAPQPFICLTREVKKGWSSGEFRIWVGWVGYTSGAKSSSGAASSIACAAFSVKQPSAFISSLLKRSRLSSSSWSLKLRISFLQLFPPLSTFAQNWRNQNAVDEHDCEQQGRNDKREKERKVVVVHCWAWAALFWCISTCKEVGRVHDTIATRENDAEEYICSDWVTSTQRRFTWHLEICSSPGRRARVTF